MNFKLNRLGFSDADIKAIDDFMRNENIISYYGTEGIEARYQSELAKFFGKEHCLLTNSGTSALYAAYFAINLQPHDEVIVQTNTFWATATPMFLLGATPILIDSEPETGNIDTTKVEDLITHNTKAIVITHLFGAAADMNKIREICDKYNIKLIEDATLSVGSTREGLMAGTVGDITCLSLGSTKMLSGGQGGTVLTSDRESYERMVLLGFFGDKAKMEVMNPFYRKFSDTGYGMNYRMHPLAIAMSYNRFKDMDNLIQRRHERYELLSQYLHKTGIIIAPRNDDKLFRGIWQGYVAQCPEAKSVAVKMQKKGFDVKAGLGYPLLHKTNFLRTKQDGLKGIDKMEGKKIYKDESFPIAEKYEEQALTFPLFLDEDISIVKSYGKALLEAVK